MCRPRPQRRMLTPRRSPWCDPRGRSRPGHCTGPARRSASGRTRTGHDARARRGLRRGAARSPAARRAPTARPARPWCGPIRRPARGSAAARPGSGEGSSRPAADSADRRTGPRGGERRSRRPTTTTANGPTAVQPNQHSRALSKQSRRSSASSPRSEANRVARTATRTWCSGSCPCPRWAARDSAIATSVRPRLTALDASTGRPSWDATRFGRCGARAAAEPAAHRLLIPTVGGRRP
jgi:hypothetical protein